MTNRKPPKDEVDGGPLATTTHTRHFSFWVRFIRQTATAHMCVASNYLKEMAIYQYHLTVVPRQTILRHWDIIPVNVQVHNNPAFDEDDLMNVNWWNKEQIDFGTIEKRILDFADQVEWTKRSQDIKTFGDNERNDITIVKGELGLLEEMSFRLDLRELDRSFIDNVLTIVKDLDCILLDRQGNLFDPTHKNLAENIKKSNAFKFVSNPTDFLANLVKEIKTE